ncbi:MAG: hypothetical protein AB7J13_05080 [Pyrinomonadaceae bacterium]
MKRFATGRTSPSNKLNILVATVALMVAGLACGSKTPPPPEYVGVWTSGDGATITIRSDGGADYKSGGTSVSGGSAVIDGSAKTLKISLASLGPTFKIDKAPTGNEMTLDGIVFKKSGGGSDNDSDSRSGDVKPEIPSEEKLQTLVKTTFLDFGDAVQSEDFSDFHNKVAKVWRDDSSPDKLAEAFKTFVDKKDDYNFKRAVTPMDATFTPEPKLDKVGGLDALIVKGYYPTKPQRANFELKYVMDDGSWKLIGINIRTTSR